MISPQVLGCSISCTLGIVSSIMKILSAAANASKRCVTTKVRENVEENEAAATNEIKIVPVGLLMFCDIKYAAITIIDILAI